MSVYYSRFDLNTYRSTPYFQAQLPKGYPINLVLIKGRAFRRLPPHIRQLSKLAKRWAQNTYSGVIGTNDIKRWYDEEGYELTPGTGKRLTDKEIDAQWPESNGQATAPEVKDIPIPDGGFADPDTWKEPPSKPEELDPDDGISEEQLTKDIASHGREFVANEAGIPKSQLKHIKSDKELARLILGGSKIGKPLAISDAESAEMDTPSTLVSDTEILPAIGAFPQEQNKPVTVDDLPRKIQVTTDWGRLRAVVVGRLDNDVLPAWYPSFDNPDGNEVDEPETTGQTKEEYDPRMFRRAVKQTEALCGILEKEGVKVFRPNLISPADAQADPIGLTSEWAREMFTVVGNKVIVNQTRAAHRNKDREALTPLFLEIERSGKAQIVYPPTTDWQRRDDDLENDPRPFIEGGDIFRFGNDVLVTMSYLATSPAGYRWLADELEPDGISVWPAYLTPKWEHGDYVFFPVREGLCIAYLKGFKDGMLPVPCQDWQVIEITHDEANNGFAANGLVLRENVMLLPKGLPRVRRALEKRGVDVIEVPFDGPMFWQGAIDCATSELWRDG